jgi:hypothetical protein
VAIVWCFIAFAGENGWLLTISLLCILGVFIQYTFSDRSEFEKKMRALATTRHNALIDAARAAEGDVPAPETKA